MFTEQIGHNIDSHDGDFDCDQFINAMFSPAELAALTMRDPVRIPGEEFLDLIKQPKVQPVVFPPVDYPAVKYEKFQRILKRRGPGSLEEKYPSPESLEGKFVVYSDKSFKVFESLDMFSRYLNQLPMTERTYHETILYQEQKLKFDIDADIDEVDKFPDNRVPDNWREDLDPQTRKYQFILGTIMDAICDTFFINYGKNLRGSDLVICESVHPKRKKFSNHIVINSFCVTNHKQAAEFTKVMMSLMPKIFHPFIDLSVNKIVQMFRLAGCHKIADARMKNITTDHTFADSVVGNTAGCELLDDLVVGEVEINHAEATTDAIAAALAICKREGLLENHTFKFARESMLVFERSRPSHCDFCKRSHDKDNTLFVTIARKGGVNIVREYCRRYHPANGNRFRTLGDFPSEDFAEDDPLAGLSYTDRTIERAVGGQTPLPLGMFGELPPGMVIKYDEPRINDFKLSKTLVVRAAMKMGKTKALIDYLDTHFSGTIVPPVIRFVSFRRTFSGNVKGRFADFTLYSDVKGVLDQPKLIVQVESLHRLCVQPGNGVPDLLILDECESIFEQFDSGLLKDNFNACLATFEYLMRESEHVICMDANISDRTFTNLQKMRMQFAQVVSGELPAEVVYHWNTHKNATDDKYFICGDKKKWLGLLYSCLDADERLAIPISSISEAKVLVKNIESKYPDMKVKIYSSETSPAEKNTHFANVDHYWSQFHVLVYTPTVSAGVSYEVKHFDKVFGYFTDQTCPVETCQQMIGRIRDVSDKEYYIYLKAQGTRYPTEIEDIKQSLYKSRNRLLAPNIAREINHNGEMIYHTSAYFNMWLYNIRSKNLSKSFFINRFIRSVMATGATVERVTAVAFAGMTGLDETELVDINTEHKESKRCVVEGAIKDIVDAEDIGDAEVGVIEDLILDQKDITPVMKHTFARRKLRDRYDYHHAITTQFVTRFNKESTYQTYKNLNVVTGFDSSEGALRHLQRNEFLLHARLMAGDGESQNEDLNTKYTFDRHKFTLDLLATCGWGSINDAGKVTTAELHGKLHEGVVVIDDVWCQFDGVRGCFAVRNVPTIAGHAKCGTNGERVKYLLGIVNKLLGVMYGAKIGISKGEYSLRRSKWFTSDPVISQKKNIVLIAPVAEEGFIDAG